MVDAPPPLLRQPMFNAPWPALTVAGLIVATYALQLRLADQGLSLALFPAQVAAGHPAGLLTSLFLHVGWPHVLMNAGFALAFGAPVARLFGHGVRGVSAFFGFYTLCGLLAGLAFVALHPAGLDPVVGASGAVSGLMGSAARLLQTPDKAMLSGPDVPPTLGPLFSRAALSRATAWRRVR